MRGGRNRLGKMYRSDRARRMQQFRSTTSSSTDSPSATSTTSKRNSTSHAPPPASAFTFKHEHQSTSSSTPSYDHTGIQSPTLSSSTQSPRHDANNGKLLPPRSNHVSTASASTATNGATTNDNLAALLSSSIDEHHLLRSAAAAAYAPQAIKSEMGHAAMYDPSAMAHFSPFVHDAYSHLSMAHTSDYGHQALHAHGGFMEHMNPMTTLSYASMMPVNPLAQLQHATAAGTVGTMAELSPSQTSSSASAASTHSPTATMIGGRHHHLFAHMQPLPHQHHYPAAIAAQQSANGGDLLATLAASLTPDETQWMQLLISLVRQQGDRTPNDPFAIACTTIDQILFNLVGWVRNAPFFEQLEVSSPQS